MARKSKIHFHIYMSVNVSTTTTFRIRIHLINWKRQGSNLQKLVRSENLHLCKLEFHLCIRLNHGEYQLVSPPSYSSIIEEGNIRYNQNIFS
jgi:hypothetical protein